LTVNIISVFLYLCMSLKLSDYLQTPHRQVFIERFFHIFLVLVLVTLAMLLLLLLMMMMLMMLCM